MRSSALAVLALAGISACADRSSVTTPAPTTTARPTVAPRAAELDALARSLRAQGIKTWAQMPDSLLWRFIAGGDSVAVLGIKEPGKSSGVDRGKSIVPPGVAVAGFAAIKAVPDVVEIGRDTLRPMLILKLGSMDAMRQLRRSPFTAYLEPNRLYEYQNSDSGCGAEPFETYLPRPVTPEGDTIPFTYQWMHIDRAWGVANGANVTVGVTDTKSDPMQYELGAGFSTGAVPGRSIGWDGDHYGPGCEHGTKTAGVIGAPRNGRHMVGVAYGSNLFNARSGDDLTPSGSVAAIAIRNAALNYSKVIMMAWGTGYGSTPVDEEINYWYYWHSRTFVGAAGTLPCDITSQNNVLWPAEKHEVIAVSPVQYDGTRPCSAAYGDALDVVAYHGQPTTATASKQEPYFLPFETQYPGQMAKITSSSNAAAVVTGVVALMLQRFGHLGPPDVRNRLIASADCVRPGKPGSWHKMINAEAAIGGLCVTSLGVMSGTAKIEFWDQDGDLKPGTFTARPQYITGGQGTPYFRWEWPEGPATTTYTKMFARPSGEEGYDTIWLLVYDPGSNVGPLLFERQVRLINWSAYPCNMRPRNPAYPCLTG